MANTLTYQKGITRSPSDLLAADGELEECVNLEVVDGELRTAEMPVKMDLSLEEGEKLELVHTTESGLRCYITITKQKVSQSVSTYTLRALKQIDGTYYRLSLSKTFAKEPNRILSMGNILMAFFDESVEYFIYKDNDYSYIGNAMPELDIAFSLTGSMGSEGYTLEETGYVDIDGTHFPEMDDEGETAQKVLGFVNKFINEKCMERGYFMFPFFVRWAYRLFDGTHSHQSAPILMLPSTYAAPLCGLKADDNGTTRTSQFPIYVASYLSEIVAKVDSDQLETLKSWSDIIVGIDFYVSRQIYSYDQSGDGATMDYYNLASSKFDYMEMKQSEAHGKTDVSAHQYNGVHNMYTLASLSVTDFGNYTFQLPYRAETDIYKDIRENAIFYKYAYLQLSDIKSGDNSLKDAGLETTSNDIILQQETLDDDYQSHDQIVPSCAITYNKRLNVSGISRKLFNGFSPRAMLQDLTATNYFDDLTGNWQAQVRVDGATLVSDTVQASPYTVYVYYPDVNADYMWLVNTDSKKTYMALPLTEHTGLNGSYYFSGFGKKSPTTGSESYVKEQSSQWNKEANSLWLSEVSNPFHFDLNGMYTVGNGDVIGMSALVRPVSQGQFGEYPLIAFCTDGNYGLRVNDSGYYTNISPMQEDVALSQDQITNMESTILIITKKGIMETNGSNITPLASQMDGRVRDLPDGAGGHSGWDSLIGSAKDAEGFLSYLYGARMAYDYASNRVFIYRTDKTFLYMLRMDSKTVTKIVIGDGESVQTHVVDYPDVILQTDKALYSLYTKEDVSQQTDRRKGFALTRPLALGAAYTLKVVERVKSLFAGADGSSVRYALYGSNDNVTYQRCTSRFGRAWKYYKLAIYTDMLPGEGLAGTSVEVSERRNHKLR